MEEKIIAVKEAFALEPQEFRVNNKSKFGIKVIRSEVITVNAPPDFNKRVQVIQAYDKDGKLLHRWNPDSVNLEFG